MKIRRFHFTQAFRDALRAEWMRAIRAIAQEAEATGGQRLPRPLAEIIVERAVRESRNEC